MNRNSGFFYKGFVILLMSVSICIITPQLSFGASPIIIDHTCTDICKIPESAINQSKSNLHIAYGHTSHGSQLTTGMTGLIDFANNEGLGLSLPEGIFEWNNGGTGGALDLHDGAMAGDCGYYPQWVNETREYLDDPSHSDVNVIIWSWCGQVDDKYAAGTLYSEYLAPMSQLETEYPGVTFVYMTGHVDHWDNADNKAANQMVMDYCINNNKVLYDFADIETYDPDGTFYEFPHDNCDYYESASGPKLGNWAIEWQDSHAEGVDWYNCPSAHSQPLNANRKAYAAWWLWARLAGWNPNGAPVANFSGSPTTGSAPLAVSFTDSSTGEITGWLWTFGDEGTSTEQNSTHIYDAAGTYTVTLEVTGSGGSHTESKTDFIRVWFYEPCLYFSHIASNSTWETEICILNTSSEQSLSGDLKAYNNSGQEVSSTPVILASNGRREIIIGNELPNPSDIGYIIFESDSENVCGYTKFYIEGKYRVAVPAVSEINTSDIYISHIASTQDWGTGISLVNTTSSTKVLTIEFDNGETKTKTLAANEHSAFMISSLFDDQPQTDIQSAVIKNGSGIVGLELFGSSDSSGDNYLSGILLKDETTTHIYYPHIASDSTWWTGIVAYNPSITSCTLNITPFRDNGTLLTPQTILLAGQEKYIGMVQDLDLPEGTAWFKIDATSPITGFELFGTNDGKQLGGYTGVGISSTDGVFAKTEKDGWTGIVFVNIENSTATVTMTAYDDTGNVIATETLNIDAYVKVVNWAPNLFSQDISNATYISYSSNREVVGFQLNGSSDDMMLDALPGM